MLADEKKKKKNGAPCKGAPASKSRLPARLVSPVSALEKKKKDLYVKMFQTGGMQVVQLEENQEFRAPSTESTIEVVSRDSSLLPLLWFTVLLLIA